MCVCNIHAEAERNMSYISIFAALFGPQEATQKENLLVFYTNNFNIIYKLPNFLQTFNLYQTPFSPYFPNRLPNNLPERTATPLQSRSTTLRNTPKIP